MIAKDKITAVSTRFRILSEYRGALIQFTDTETNQCFLLRADKIAQDITLIQNFNSYDAMQIGYSAAYISHIQSVEQINNLVAQKISNTATKNDHKKSLEQVK